MRLETGNVKFDNSFSIKENSLNLLFNSNIRIGIQFIMKYMMRLSDNSANLNIIYISNTGSHNLLNTIKDLGLSNHSLVDHIDFVKVFKLSDSIELIHKLEPKENSFNVIIMENLTQLVNSSSIDVNYHELNDSIVKLMLSLKRLGYNLKFVVDFESNAFISKFIESTIRISRDYLPTDNEAS